MRTHSKPGAIKPYHEGAGKRDTRSVAIAPEQRHKMLEENLQQQKEWYQSESGPSERVAR
jgi:hypothetical protein